MRLTRIISLATAILLVLGCASPVGQNTPAPAGQATVPTRAGAPQPMATPPRPAAGPLPSPSASPTAAATAAPTPSSDEQANGTSYAPSISADGRYVAFMSRLGDLVAGEQDTNGVDDIFVHDCLAGTTERVSVASR